MRVVNALPERRVMGLHSPEIKQVANKFNTVCNSLCYVRFSCSLHSVVNLIKTMQHTVAKRFIYCKHNIALWNTQAISQKVVTFFAEGRSWSHTSLFVWDWNCRARRIASDFTRFYRIAKGVTRRIWLDLCTKPHLSNTIAQMFGAKRQAPL